MHYIVSVSSFAIILKRKGKVVALLLLSFRCIVTIVVLLLFLTVPWVGVILVFPDHIHLLLYILKKIHFIIFMNFFRGQTDKTHITYVVWPCL